jgi:hypothetical protein
MLPGTIYRRPLFTLPLRYLYRRLRFNLVMCGLDVRFLTSTRKEQPLLYMAWDTLKLELGVNTNAACRDKTKSSTCMRAGRDDDEP